MVTKRKKKDEKPAPWVNPVPSERWFRIAQEGYYFGYTGNYRVDFHGLNHIVYCTPEFMRNILRWVFEQGMKNGKHGYVAVHDKATNTIYEGCRFSSWSSGGDQPERATFTQVGIVTLEIPNIIDLQIGY